MTDEVYQKLDILQRDKEILNEYAKQVYLPIPPLDKSIFGANGIIASLDDCEDVIFPINNVCETNNEQLNYYLFILSRFADTIDKMTFDYKTNPWRDCNLTFLSNEFRHDTLGHLHDLLPAINALDIELADTETLLHLNNNHTINNINKIIDILTTVQNAKKVPIEWILTDDSSALFDEITNCAKLKEKLIEDNNTLSTIYATIRANNINVNLSSTKDLNTLASLSQEHSTVTGVLLSKPYDLWNISDLEHIEHLLSQASETAQVYQARQAQVLSAYEANVFALDYQSIISNILIEFNQSTRIYHNILPTQISNQSYSNLIVAIANNISSLQAEISTWKNIKQQLLACKDYLSTIYPTIIFNDPLAPITDIKYLQSYEDFQQEEYRLRSFMESHSPYLHWQESELEDIISITNKAAEVAQNINTQKSHLLSTYEPSIFDLDYVAMLGRVKTEYTSFTKVFNKDYREDKKAIQLCHHDIVKKITDEEMLSVIEKLRTLDETRKWYIDNEEKLHRYFGDNCPNENSNYSVYTNQFTVFKAINNVRKTLNQLMMLANTIREKEQLFTEMLSLAEQLRRLDETKAWYAENADLLHRYFGENCPDENSDYTIYEKQIATYKALNNALAIIDQMKTVCQDIADRELTLYEHYRFLYNGILSDWESIREALTWAIDFKNAVAQINVSEAFIRNVCQADDFIAICRQEQEKLEELRRNIAFEYNWFIANFDNPEAFNDMELSVLCKRLNACMNGLSLLEEWIDFRTAKSNCLAAGLGDVVRAIEENNIPANNIVPVFKKRFFRLWLDAVLPNYPAVLNFRRRTQEETISEFATLDKLQFEIAKARIKTKLISELPSLEHFTSGLDELSILRRELAKQKRIMPIRKLFQNIPNLLLTLKPCLMMSPLSVSLFLEAKTYQFDIVIFDEASQVCTENAIGAISRGKQVVIAGDSKQLPPTNFFQAALSDGDFDDEDADEFDDINAYESILDEANMLPERTLRWHYRSRHESLIAFSNAKIYKNNLITFPSNIEKADNNGVEYIYVSNGFYDKGGRKGNIAEANTVADLVFKHFKEQPNRTLGVIAFGEVQQQAIETVIRERRLQNQKFEPFFAEDTEEAFFIKNLENVQGDERDTIIFSIGYAKDVNGIFRMNFGPLSKAGGERRLNVAITRAKYNVKLVGSIMPTDIDTNRISSDGPKLLRSYIDFAINGPEVLQREITESDIVEHDSPFEESVYKFLDRRGYKLATQVGCSGYRIDMAVKHPTLNGTYVLGIECDGAAYHSARTARERDRLRQDVLESMGWKIYRIWSTDWIKDPISEGQRLIEAIESAIACFGVADDMSAVTPLASEPPATEPTLSDPTLSMDDFVSIEDKPNLSENTDNPYEFATLAPIENFNSLNIKDCITAIINNEYPIHYELLCQRLAPQFGRERATSAVRREVDFILSKLRHSIIRKEDFLFPANYTDITVKMPNTRKIQHICTEELAAAMLHILSHCIGTTKSGLCTETMRAYGFNRSSAKITAAMQAAIDLLFESGKIEEIEGKLKINN